MLGLIHVLDELVISLIILCHCLSYHTMRLSYHTMRFVPSKGKKDSKRRRSWWQRFFFDDNDDGNWLGLREEDIVDEMSDEEKLETWKKRRAEVIVELREVQEEIGDNVDGDVRQKWEPILCWS